MLMTGQSRSIEGFVQEEVAPRGPTPAQDLRADPYSPIGTIFEQSVTKPTGGCGKSLYHGVAFAPFERLFKLSS